MGVICGHQSFMEASPSLLSLVYLNFKRCLQSYVLVCLGVEFSIVNHAMSE